MTPILLWDETLISADGAAMACPQCTSPNLHLDTIHFATPTEDHYTPTIGLSINTATAVATANDQHASNLHAGRNRGPMLAIGYWCENGCLGRIELRDHKGSLYASLHNEPPQTLDHDDPPPQHDSPTGYPDEIPY